jgi:hypothetical protein
MRLRIIGFLCALVLFQCFARAGSTLYVTSSLNTVVRVNSLNSNTDIATGLNDPYDIVYHNGKLYVTESSGASVLTMDITGANRQVFATTAANSVPAGLAFGPDGGLYIADLTNNRIEKTFGGTTTLFASGLNGPEGLAFDSGGNLYVADFYSNSIVKIDPSGATYPFASIHLPADVAFDRFGQMYVSSYHDDIIYKVSPLGVVTPFAINLGSAQRHQLRLRQRHVRHVAASQRHQDGVSLRRGQHVCELRLLPACDRPGSGTRGPGRPYPAPGHAASPAAQRMVHRPKSQQIVRSGRSAAFRSS